jgi:hypothetical protein
MQLKTIKQEEYQKYQDILAKYGFNKADFTLMEEPAKTKTLPDDVQPKGAITIIHRNNNRSKTYPSSTGNPWTKLFEQDLSAGYFK